MSEKKQDASTPTYGDKVPACDKCEDDNSGVGWGSDKKK